MAHPNILQVVPSPDGPYSIISLNYERRQEAGVVSRVSFKGWYRRGTKYWGGYGQGKHSTVGNGHHT